MDQRPTILLLIPHLHGGGAERVFALLAGGLSCEKYNLHLATMTGPLPAEDQFPARLTVHALGAMRVRGATLALVKLIRSLRPQVVLAGMFHLNLLVLLLRPLFPQGTRIVVRQNGTAPAALASATLPAYTGLLYRWLYPRADRVVCQSETMANDLIGLGWVRPEKIRVLLNPVDVDGIRRIATQSHLQPVPWQGAGPHLLAVGRLSPEKGFDRLLEAFKHLRKAFPEASLLIAGTGSEQPALESQSARLGLGSAVSFPGYLAQPATLFAGATAFVLSSWHEGMPNAMLEAAAAGLPIVAVPAAGGVGPLLRGQTGVWLASENTTAGLSASLLEALHALKPGERFAHPFVEPFRMERAIAAYENLLDAEIVAWKATRPGMARSRA